MEKTDLALKKKKIDALYLYYNYRICLLVYYSLCFTWMRILQDMTGERTSLLVIYISSFVFSCLMGIIMSRWAKQVVNASSLDHII